VRIRRAIIERRCGEDDRSRSGCGACPSSAGRISAASLVAQRHDGLDARGTKRRDGDSRQRNDQERGAGRGIGRRIPRSDPEHKRRQHATEPDPRAKADGEPAEDELCTLVEQGAEDGLPCSAKRQADADLVRALIDDVGE
jgi:hypothetical protein